MERGTASVHSVFVFSLTVGWMSEIFSELGGIGIFSHKMFLQIKFALEVLITLISILQFQICNN